MKQGRPTEAAAQQAREADRLIEGCVEGAWVEGRFGGCWVRRFTRRRLMRQALDGRMTNVDSLQSSLPLTPLLVVPAGDQDNRWDQQTP